MSRFIQVSRHQHYLLPPSIDEGLPENHLARFIAEVLDQLDLSQLTRRYTGRGSAAHRLSVLLALLVYGYATDVSQQTNDKQQVEPMLDKLNKLRMSGLRWQKALNQTAPGSKMTSARSKRLSDCVLGRRNPATIFNASFLS